MVITTGVTPDVEATIYVGHAHNWTELKELRLAKEGEGYRIQCKAIVAFEDEGVAQNEPFEIETTAKYIGEV